MKSFLKITTTVLLSIGYVAILQSCKKKELPEVATAAVSGITQTSAISGGNIINNGGSEVTARGVCWETSTGPTVAGLHTSDGNGNGTFTSNITGLIPSTDYYIRAYATNSAGTAYGNEYLFTTSPVVAPTLTTIDASSITTTTAITGGIITSAGGGAISTRGVCWGKSLNPTIWDSHTSNGTGIGTFTSNITGLTPGNIYYVRAYASNETGTGYGNQIELIVPGIGSFYEGGIIFYLDASGEHGLVAASSDQNVTLVEWDNGYHSAVGATGLYIGTGERNTNTIIESLGNGNYAARLCFDLSLNDYSDWYLPSAYELNEIFKNKTAIGGFEGLYWSSSEYDYFNAYYSFEYGQIGWGGKPNPCKVRAIRAF